MRVCAQVADGLEALRKAGMVHRDVKPENILLDLDGTAYITDFGLAKDSAGTVLTRPGQPLGSMDYMAPEQIRGQPVTSAADTYSLGCVVFECLSGRPPFADRDGLQVLWAHLQDEPPDLPADRTDLSAAFGALWRTALVKGAGRATANEHRVRAHARRRRRDRRSPMKLADLRPLLAPR